MINLLKFLKENQDSRKIFGKRELKIIEKQLTGVNLTQSEKNRLSRDIRKKLEFVKELARFSDEFKLKKGALIKERIEEVKEAIFETKYLSRIKEIILFGSAAENNLNLFSDIDIAVKFSHIEQNEATEFRLNILSKVSEKVDIQVYNTLPDKIKKEIDKKGRVIWMKE